MNLLEITFAMLAGLAGMWLFTLIRSPKAPPAKPTGPKPVDNYVIAHSDGDFPNVLVTFQLDDRSEHGPFAFVPPFAHMLADELTIASVRAAPKRSGRPSLVAAGILDDDDEQITDDAGVNGSGGADHG